MTTVSYTAYGQSHSVTLSPPHILSGALDSFLCADNPGVEIRAVIELSVGMEIFLKKELHLINPLLVNPRFSKSASLASILATANQQNSRPARRTAVLSALTSLPRASKVITFDQALLLFPYFRRIPARSIAALDGLRLYRNGLFHWEADHASLFALATRSLDLYLWLFSYLERKIGWLLGNELNILDPLAEKRQRLRELNTLRRNERLFNVKRRILRHHHEDSTYSRIKARADRVVTRPNGVPWPQQRCPACGNSALQLEDWRSIRDGRREKGVIAVVCNMCQLFLTEDEYDRINSTNPRLRQIAEHLGLEL